MRFPHGLLLIVLATGVSGAIAMIASGCAMPGTECATPLRSSMYVALEDGNGIVAAASGGSDLSTPVYGVVFLSPGFASVSRANSHFTAGCVGGEDLVHEGVTREGQRAIAEMAIEYNGITETVSIDGRTYELRQGRVFVVEQEFPGASRVIQLASLVRENWTSAEVLQIAQTAVPDNKRLQRVRLEGSVPP